MLLWLKMNKVEVTTRARNTTVANYRPVTFSLHIQIFTLSQNQSPVLLKTSLKPHQSVVIRAKRR